MSTKIELLSRLKTNMNSFLQELSERFPNEVAFITFQLFINRFSMINLVMDYIVNKLCPLHDMVTKRDESFFLNNNIMFSELDQSELNQVNYFKNIWVSDNLTSEEKDAIWRWFDLFIRIGNSYKNAKN